MFCKVLPVGYLIVSEKDFMTGTRRPGVCGSDSFSVCFPSSSFLRPILKVFRFNCFCVLLFFSVLSQIFPLAILNLLSF